MFQRGYARQRILECLNRWPVRVAALIPSFQTGKMSSYRQQKVKMFTSVVPKAFLVHSFGTIPQNFRKKAWSLYLEFVEHMTSRVVFWHKASRTTYSSCSWTRNSWLTYYGDRFHITLCHALLYIHHTLSACRTCWH